MSSSNFAIFTEDGVLFSYYLQELIKDLEEKHIVGNKTITVNLSGGSKVTFTLTSNKKHWWHFLAKRDGS